MNSFGNHFYAFRAMIHTKKSGHGCQKRLGGANI